MANSNVTHVTIRINGEKKTVPLPTTLADAVRMVGGDTNAVSIINQYLKNKARETENQELLKLAKEAKRQGKDVASLITGTPKVAKA